MEKTVVRKHQMIRLRARSKNSYRILVTTIRKNLIKYLIMFAVFINIINAVKRDKELPVILIPANEPVNIEVVRPEREWQGPVNNAVHEVTGTVTGVAPKAVGTVMAAPKEVNFDHSNAWYKDYTSYEQYLLGALAVAEFEEYLANIDDPKVEYAVELIMSVALNRVQAKNYYPNDLEKVLWQNYGKKGQQYATRTLKIIDSGVEVPQKVLEIAERLLQEGPVGPENLVFQDNLIHGDVFYQYGGMYFCTTEL
ncbi:MAG: hypothetical protein J6M60_01125 [Clostridia bacterium]|nr:hypothetical protein [Clostridia bacterium]